MENITNMIPECLPGEVQLCFLLELHMSVLLPDEMSALQIHPDSIPLLGASFTKQSLAAGEDGPTCLNKSLAVDVLTWVA